MTSDPSAVRLLNGDCLSLMASIPDGSISLILCDLPYGCTNCTWDRALPLPDLWAAYRRILKPGGTVALFGTFRFGLKLIESQPQWFRYHWILRKNRGLGFLDANRRPLRAHEFLFIFSERQGTYHPQKTPGTPYKSRNKRAKPAEIYHTYRTLKKEETVTTRFPLDVIDFPQVPHPVHPTQKPVELLQKMILTYTNPGETVLDNTMDSGSTGVAALQTGRRFIGIESDAKYFEIAKARIGEI